MTQCSQSVLDAALEMLALDIWPVPIKAGTKQPHKKYWPELRLTVDDLLKSFSNGNGLGVLLGIQPRSIADVDVDCPEALAIAPLIQGPMTDRIFGRASKPSSHYLFELPEEFRPVQFQDTCDKKAMLIELRGRSVSKCHAAMASTHSVTRTQL